MNATRLPASTDRLAHCRASVVFPMSIAPTNIAESTSRDRSMIPSCIPLIVRSLTTGVCASPGAHTLQGMRPATAIVTLVLLLVIAGAAVYQTVVLLNPPESVPSQLQD